MKPRLASAGYSRWGTPALGTRQKPTVVGPKSHRTPTQQGFVTTFASSRSKLNFFIVLRLLLNVLGRLLSADTQVLGESPKGHLAVPQGLHRQSMVALWPNRRLFKVFRRSPNCLKAFL